MRESRAAQDVWSAKLGEGRERDRQEFDVSRGLSQLLHLWRTFIKESVAMRGQRRVRSHGPQPHTMWDERAREAVG